MKFSIWSPEKDPEEMALSEGWTLPPKELEGEKGVCRFGFEADSWARATETLETFLAGWSRGTAWYRARF